MTDAVLLQRCQRLEKIVLTVLMTIPFVPLQVSVAVEKALLFCLSLTVYAHNYGKRA